MILPLHSLILSPEHRRFVHPVAPDVAKAQFHDEFLWSLPLPPMGACVAHFGEPTCACGAYRLWWWGVN